VLIAYVVCLIVLGSLDPATVKSPISVLLQPILMVAGIMSAAIAVVWAWRKREARLGATLAAALLFLIVLTVHLPSYLRMVDDIAAAQAEFQRRSAGKP
jgi:hypothetical protein